MNTASVRFNGRNHLDVQRLVMLAGAAIASIEDSRIIYYYRSKTERIELYDTVTFRFNSLFITKYYSKWKPQHN